MGLFHDFDTVSRPVKSTMNWADQAQIDNDNIVIASALRKDALNAIKRAKNAKWKQIAEDKVALHNQFVKNYSTYVSVGTKITLPW
jgi:hypothetical protein